MRKRCRSQQIKDALAISNTFLGVFPLFSFSFPTLYLTSVNSLAWFSLSQVPTLEGERGGGTTDDWADSHVGWEDRRGTLPVQNNHE